MATLSKNKFNLISKQARLSKPKQDGTPIYAGNRCNPLYIRFQPFGCMIASLEGFG
jgi:hypothetical protein